MLRSTKQKAIDLFTFPFRALTLFHEDKWGLSCLASERFDYVAREVKGYCLDVGCGYHNRFVHEYLSDNGKGIDVYPYKGLSQENLVEDLTQFPFPDQTFDTVTFIACINHAQPSQRDKELAEAFRVLKPQGNVIITMGNRLAEILTHKSVEWYDRYLGTHVDMDNERGMHEHEEYYLLDSEIIGRLRAAGFQHISKKYFWTQWGLNHLFIGWKP